MKRFKGDSDGKAAAKEMPMEYEVLRPQNINSLIVVPVYTNRKLTGFIGVDNPDLDSNDVFIKLLSDIGGHPGSVRENLLKYNRKNGSIYCHFSETRIYDTGVQLDAGQIQKQSRSLQ